MVVARKQKRRRNAGAGTPKREMEMTATNTHPATTATAPMGPADGPDTVTATMGGPQPDGAAGAVWDALTANPGATTMMIASAAGVSRATAVKALTAMADAGHAVRTPGGRTEGGRPLGDTWAAGDGTADDAGTTATDTAPDDGAISDAGLTGAPVTELTSADDADPAPGPDTAAEEAGDDEAAVADPEPSPAIAPPSPVVTGQTIQDAMRILEAEQERRASAETELQRAQAEEEARRAKAVAELQRARTTEATRRALADLLAAVTTTYAAVISGDTDAVTTGLEEIYAETATVRRVTKTTPTRTATTGTTTARAAGNGARTAPRPLRPSVAAHLAAHLGKDFTPGEIAKVLGRSSGAVANALDSLVKQGEAELTCEHPNRYRAITTAAASNAHEAA
jgi:DNA-binding MarR family transcriptional regulator